jgi:hypothetical protein
MKDNINDPTQLVFTKRINLYLREVELLIGMNVFKRLDQIHLDVKNTTSYLTGKGIYCPFGKLIILRSFVPDEV